MEGLVDTACERLRVRVTDGVRERDLVMEALAERELPLAVRVAEPQRVVEREMLGVVVEEGQREGEGDRDTLLLPLRVTVSDFVWEGLALLEGTEACCDRDRVRDTVTDELGLPLGELASAVPRSRERAARRCRAEVGKEGRSRSSGDQPLLCSTALPARTSRGAEEEGARRSLAGARPEGSAVGRVGRGVKLFTVGVAAGFSARHRRKKWRSTIIATDAEVARAWV